MIARFYGSQTTLEEFNQNQTQFVAGLAKALKTVADWRKGIPGAPVARELWPQGDDKK